MANYKRLEETGPLKNGLEGVGSASIPSFQPLSWGDEKNEHGPLDIIGDIHGCGDELLELLAKLGYSILKNPDGEDGYFSVTHPEGRKVVFLGDLVDRGPRIVLVLKLAMSMVWSGMAYCLPGNHDMKLLRKLNGRNVQVQHGLEETLRQLLEEPPKFSEEVREFLTGMVRHYLFNDGKLVVAHAGLKEELQRMDTKQAREFALYGETTGELDEYGLPVRLNWAGTYRGKAMVVYGHTPKAEAEWENGTINIDTGCVFGGKLTALRYPELELMDVPARREYAEPGRPFLPEEVGV